MTPFQVTGGPVTFGQGQALRLTSAQALARGHNLEIGKAKKGLVDVTVKSPVEFKAGEVIYLSECPKHLGNRLVDLDQAERSAVVEEPAQPVSDEAAAGAASA